jgi:hypothetical protein
MSRSYTRDDVLRLAPDAGSAKSGQDLAQTRKWVTLSSDGVALWGECQGSGAKPYRVQIDLGEPAFKCSCPSRKFPCKHGLGLLLIFATIPDAVQQAAQPEWVSEWLSSRAERASKAAEKSERKPAVTDPAAQAKRRARRIEKVRSGLGDLALWMRDLVRSGLAGVPGRGFEFFDGQARRMVDAQGPGVARRIRNLGSLAASGVHWQRPFLEQLSLLHLLARAVEGFDQLPAVIQADIESTLGIPMAAEELIEMPGIVDVWQVVGQEVVDEDRLRVERTWLLGTTSQRPALVLQFAHGTSAFDMVLAAGTQFEGELVYFPGSGLRAALRRVAPSGEAITSLSGCESFDDLLGRYSDALAANVWLDSLCLPVKNLTPACVGEDWYLVDAAGDALPLTIRDDEAFVLLAISGGMPIDVAAEYDGTRLRPLAVVEGGRWQSLTTTNRELATR